MKKLIILSLVVGTISSCTVTSSSYKTSQRRLNRQPEANAASTQLVNKPILADLEVGSKRETSTLKTTNLEINSTTITDGSNKKSNSGMFVSAGEGMKNEAKYRAQFKFMDDLKCDYIVDPIYKIETEATSGSSVVNISVEVSGYPAFYKKFSQPDSLPKSVFQMGGLNSREIPLLTSGSSMTKSAAVSSPKEKGLLILLGSTKTPDISDSKLGLAGKFGLYKNFPIKGGFSFRTEYLLAYSSQRYSTIGYQQIFDPIFGSFYSGETKIDWTNSQITFEIPLLLNLDIKSKLRLNFGYSLNYAFTNNAKLKETGTLVNIFGQTINYSEETTIDGDGGFYSGVVIGAQYLASEKFSIGIRRQGGGGDFPLSATFLTMGFKL